ncbi:MAG TPA: PDZ domain-containing protein [Gemmatimonadaceae bacterium]|nr:PDZ domain-containing protein [Gemmatimonadaceae bacterium]
MRTSILISVAFTVAATATFVPPAAAQVEVRTAPRAFAFSVGRDDSPRAVIGVTLATDNAADTLGVRVSEVADSSPAALAGIVEGDRLQAINGVDLRLAKVDVGDDVMANAMAHRLTRELGKLAPGDVVTLRVYHDGSLKTVTVKTVDADDLYRNRPAAVFRVRAAAPSGVRAFPDMAGMSVWDSNRAALGVSLQVTGSKRDTLGILITDVNDDGPAAKAGLEQGNRIAAINGVNLKVNPADAGAEYVAQGRYQRLQDAMRKVKPGETVKLQVYADGQFRTVDIKTVKASELGNSGMVLFRDGGPGNFGAVTVGAPQLRDEVRRVLDQAQLQRVRDEARAVRVESGLTRLFPTRRGVHFIRF